MSQLTWNTKDKQFPVATLPVRRRLFVISSAYSQIQKMRKMREIEEKYTFEGDSHGARKKKFGNLKLHKITVQLISLPLETTSTPLRYYPPSTAQEVLKFGSSSRTQSLTESCIAALPQNNITSIPLGYHTHFLPPSRVPPLAGNTAHTRAPQYNSI